MVKTLLVAASLALTISSAGACEFMRSAKKVDTTTTASTSTQNMSVPDTAVPAEQVRTEELVIEKKG